MDYTSSEPVNSYHIPSFFYLWWGWRLCLMGEYQNLQVWVGFLCLSKGSVGLRNDRQTLPKLVYDPQKVKDHWDEVEGKNSNICKYSTSRFVGDLSFQIVSCWLWLQVYRHTNITSILDVWGLSIWRDLLKWHLACIPALTHTMGIY